VELTNRTILITGGSTGIGYALAKQFINNHNRVIICGRNQTKLDRAKAQLTAVETISCDINSSHDLKNLVSIVSSKFPSLDTLLNNAGVQKQMDLTSGEVNDREIVDEINTNLSAQISITQRLYPILSANKHPAIIFTGSVLGIVPKYEVPVYSAAKAGLHNFVQSLRYQSNRDGFSVFEIFPEVVKIPMTEHGTSETMMDVDDFANEVVKQLNSGKQEIFVGRTKLLNLISRLLPGTAMRIMNKPHPA
jgi:uncharacterized oxidoreductase